VASYALALSLTAMAVARQARQPATGAATAMGVALTHLWYGVQFVNGLLTRDLSR
jgi:hypothetical protein